MRCSSALRTPRQTLYAIAASTALIAGSFLAMDLRAWRLATDESIPTTWKLLILVGAVGLAGRIILLRGLRNGVQQGLWSEDDLAAARQVAESPAWTIALWVFLIASFILFILPVRGHFLGIFGTLPVLSPAEARTILRPSVLVSRASGTYSIDPVKPLKSSPWGTPPGSPL